MVVDNFMNTHHMKFIQQLKILCKKLLCNKFDKWKKDFFMNVLVIFSDIIYQQLWMTTMHVIYSHLSETNSRLRVMSETNRPAERLTKTCVMSLWWKMGLFWERVNVFYCTIYCTVTAGQNDVTLSAIFTRITSFDLKNKLINCIVFSKKYHGTYCIFIKRVITECAIVQNAW